MPEIRDKNDQKATKRGSTDPSDAVHGPPPHVMCNMAAWDQSYLKLLLINDLCQFCHRCYTLTHIKCNIM